MDRLIPPDRAVIGSESRAKSVFFSTLTARECVLESVERGLIPGRGGHGCNTVWMEPTSSVPGVHASTARRSLSAAAKPGRGSLGPISPELALIDHELAERARALLPDPTEQPKPVEFVVAAAPNSVPSAGERERRPGPIAEPRPRPRRRRRTALLAVLVFAAGAASGGLLGGKRAELPRLTLDIRAKATTTTGLRRETSPSARTTTPAKRRSATRPRHASGSGLSASAVKKARRRVSPPIWAANVLGVSAGVGAHGVTLVWQRPNGSDHVVVRRALGARKRSVIVFRGSMRSYRDLTTRPCNTYRYTIVNYDVTGHHSTGVPTSVVTPGCT
jgi:hypothetical protein